MPDHIHLVLHPDAAASPMRLQRQTAGILGAISRMARIDWQPISEPSCISDRKHLLRTLRYVVLNPCRSDLLKDPLRWRWSTYRDIFGATADPWLGPIQAWHQLPNFGLRVRIHDYVSSDGDCDLSARVPPAPPATPRYNYSLYPIQDIAIAAIVALGVPAKALTTCPKVSRYFAWLCRKVGMKDAGPIAGFCGKSERNIRWMWRHPKGPSPFELEAGLRILGEPRFRHGVTFPCPDSGQIGL